jgi:TetR/AcrR family transcriptional repressor of nem operon
MPPREDAMVATEPKRKMPNADQASTRDRIKAIARELFIQRGLNDVTYGDIAKRAGMTRANLHYHFGNKADLVSEVFRDTFAEVDAKNRAIWLSPGFTLDQRIERTLEDARMRFLQFNQDGKDRNPWSLSSRARFENTLLCDDIMDGIATMSRQFEDYVDHAVRLAIGSGELRHDAPARAIVLLIAPLWYFGSPITQHGGFRKLEEHYQAVRRVLRDGYGLNSPGEAPGERRQQ